MYEDSTAEAIFTRTRIWLILVLYFIGFLFLFPFLAGKISYLIYPHLFFNSIEWQFIIYLISSIICGYLALPLLLKERSFNIGKIISSTLICIAVMLLINVLFSLIMSFLNGPITSNNQSGLVSNISLNKGLYLITVIILAPILEEIVFRGIIFRTIRSNHGFLLAALISSLLFGFLHVYSSIFIGDFSDLIYLFLYGLVAFVFAFMYEYNRSIYAVIFLHIIYNLVANISIIF